MGASSKPLETKKKSKKETTATKPAAAGRATTTKTEDIWSYIANEHNTHDKRFTMNSIKTSKYTFFNFLPKNLFDQFSKMANVYFLFIMVL